MAVTVVRSRCGVCSCNVVWDLPHTSSLQLMLDAEAARRIIEDARRRPGQSPRGGVRRRPFFFLSFFCSVDSSGVVSLEVGTISRLVRPASATGTVVRRVRPSSTAVAVAVVVTSRIAGPFLCRAW